MRNAILKTLLFIIAGNGCLSLQGQNALPLTDLSFFQSAAPTWKLAADVKSDFTEKTSFILSPGTGILVNLVDAKNPGKDLITNLQHGDLDIQLDFMMAKGSNSGIYLQGRYEVQLLDSWGVLNATSGDVGGIYERWNESKPAGQKGYDGHAPRQNAGRAPGLWQHLLISFQAPRFDANGKKMENAKMLRVELNGVPIQENVELAGPTRGALGEDEVKIGPLRIQGDHGPVAFRNIKINNYDKPRPELGNVKYTVYKGKFDAEPDFKKLTQAGEGSLAMLSSNVSSIANDFVIKYTGNIRIKEPGEYSFNLITVGGKGTMKIKEQEVTATSQSKQRASGKVTLPAGEFPFEIVYAKFVDYAKAALGVTIAGPGIREYLVSDANIVANDPVNPILINAPVNTILRSFSDIDTIRVTHAVNVGSAEQVHYTYDMDNGMIVQLWRGNFLDATPMWHSRGDGSSKPVGMVNKFGRPMPAFEVLASPEVAWTADTAGSSYHPKGYVLDDSDRPTFRYQIYKGTVNDLIRVLPKSQGIHREVTIKDAPANLFFRLAAANNIEMVTDGLYLLNDKSYFLKIEDAGTVKPIIRKVQGHDEMIIPVQNKISYSILF